jgi:hypothetical protein
MSTATGTDVVPDAQEPELSPLDFLLRVMRDKTQSFELRFEAAKQALPYCHERLSPPDEDEEETPHEHQN